MTLFRLMRRPTRELCPARTIVCSSRSPTRSLPGACRNTVVRLLGVSFASSPGDAQEISGFLSDGVEDGQIERFRSNGHAVEHGAEEQLQHRLARGRIQVSEIR